MRIVSLQALIWTLPLRAPFVIATRTAHEARNVQWILRTDDPNVIGFGESAPVPYVTGETVETVLASAAGLAAQFTDEEVDRLEPLWAKAKALLPHAPAARAGLEMAIADAWGKRWKTPLWQHFGGRQDVLTTDVTIPLVTPEEAGQLAGEAWREGFRHLKIKVGAAAGHSADMARIEAIVRVAPEAHLRIDANQAFAPDDAVAFAERLARTGARIEMLEQPVAKEDWQGLKYVKDRVSVPVFADEAARDPASVAHLIEQDAADGINIKLMKSGLAGSLEIIALCRAAGKMLMLGCMLESRLGIAAAAQIAGGTGAFGFLDLDSHRLLAPVPGLTGGFAVEGGTLRVGNPPSSEIGWAVSVPSIPEMINAGTLSARDATNT